LKQLVLEVKWSSLSSLLLKRILLAGVWMTSDAANIIGVDIPLGD
jgi:hypothetical protein